MSLPPLANIFARFNSDPAASAELTEELRRSGEFTEIWTPDTLWVVGVKLLPNSTPDRSFARTRGLVFAEGRDGFEASQGDDQAALEALVECVQNDPAGLDRFSGDFCFLRFGENGETTAVRSCGGAVPLYLWHCQDGAAVSTSLTWMARFAATESAPDGLVSALWSVGWTWSPDRRSPLGDVTELPRGKYARLRPGGGFEIGAYWDPRPNRIAGYTERAAKEHADAFRSLLIEKLSRDLDPDGGNLLTLSGGVDSSALGALAAGLLQRKVCTLSLLPEPEGAFQREMSFIEPLSECCKFERKWAYRVGA